MKNLTYVMNNNKTMHQRCKQMKNVIIKKNNIFIYTHQKKPPKTAVQRR